MDTIKKITLLSCFVFCTLVGIDSIKPQSTTKKYSYSDFSFYPGRILLAVGGISSYIFKKSNIVSEALLIVNLMKKLHHEKGIGTKDERAQIVKSVRANMIDRTIRLNRSFLGYLTLLMAWEGKAFRDYSKLNKLNIKK